MLSKFSFTRERTLCCVRSFSFRTLSFNTKAFITPNSLSTYPQTLIVARSFSKRRRQRQKKPFEEDFMGGPIFDSSSNTVSVSRLLKLVILVGGAVLVVAALLYISGIALFFILKWGLIIGSLVGLFRFGQRLLRTIRILLSRSAPTVSDAWAQSRHPSLTHPLRKWMMRAALRAASDNPLQYYETLVQVHEDKFGEDVLNRAKNNSLFNKHVPFIYGFELGTDVQPSSEQMGTFLVVAQLDLAGSGPEMDSAALLEAVYKVDPMFLSELEKEPIMEPNPLSSLSFPEPLTLTLHLADGQEIPLSTSIPFKSSEASTTVIDAEFEVKETKKK